MSGLWREIPSEVLVMVPAAADVAAVVDEAAVLAAAVVECLTYHSPLI